MFGSTVGTRSRFRKRILTSAIALIAVAAVGVTTVAIADTDELPEISLAGVAAQGKTMTGSSALQGGVSDRSNWYTVGRTLDTDGLSTTKLLKTELWSGKKTAVRTYKPRDGKTNLLGHGNDVAYNSNAERLFIPAWENDKSTKHPHQDRAIREVDPTSLKVVGSKTAPGHTNSLCYDAVNDRYIGGAFTRGFWISDGDFKKTGGGTVSLTGTPQGIDCDKDYVYVLSSPKRGSQQGNRIFVLDWNLDLVTTYGYQANADDADEAEHLTHRMGTFYMGFNDDAGSLNRLDGFQFQTSYKAGGGTGSMDNTTVLFGAKTALRNNTFTKDGYKFAGWKAFRTPDGKVRYQNPNDPSQTKWALEDSPPDGWKPYLYGDGQQISKTTKRGALQLTAVWEKA